MIFDAEDPSRWSRGYLASCDAWRRLGHTGPLAGGCARKEELRAGSILYLDQTFGEKFLEKANQVASAPLRLVVDLVPAREVERLPEAQSCSYLDVSLPLVHLAPFEASAPAKIRIALRALGAAAQSCEPVT